MIETISHHGSITAIIVYKDHHVDGIEFITPNEFSLQLGYMSRPAGYQVIPHTHNPIRRETIGTQEVLFIKEGVIRIDFYSFEQVYLESRQLSAGDFVLLVGAGHGLTILEPATIVEVKNGPYIPGADKGRFEGVKY
ncbi:MAG: hypothetical protein WBW48_00640 [Anaerolineae bacterium]